MPFEKRINVLHILHSLERGGTEGALIKLLHGLRRNCISHHVATLRDAGVLARHAPESVSIRSLNCAGRTWSAGFNLARLVRNWDIHIVHARNSGCWMDGLVGGMLTGAHVLLGFQGWDAEDRLSPKLRHRMRWAARLGADFTSVCRFGLGQLHDHAGISLDRVTYLPNGVDSRAFAPGTRERMVNTRTRMGIPVEAFVIGTVGSLRPVKGYGILLNAFKALLHHLKPARLLIVGDGPGRDALVALANDLEIGERIHFIGQHGDVSDLLAAMDVYVCSSLAEGMSNALLEAMASGLPIVTTDVGDNAYMVRDRVDGLVVPPGSSAELARCIAELFAQPNLGARLGASARARAGDFNIDSMVSRYEELYTNLGKRNNGRLRTRSCDSRTEESSAAGAFKLPC